MTGEMSPYTVNGKDIKGIILLLLIYYQRHLLFINDFSNSKDPNTHKVRTGNVIVNISWFTTFLSWSNSAIAFQPSLLQGLWLVQASATE